MIVYGSENNFLGIEKEYSTYDLSKVVIQQLPYEYTSSYQAGSKNGPKAIVDASHFVEYYDEELDKETFKDIGICTVAPLQFQDKVDQEAINLIEKSTSKHLKNGKFVLSFGAEHTVTLGLFNAYYKSNSKVSILQIDAHSDLRDSYQGNKYSHASVMARINDLNVKISQVGIRAQCIEESLLIKQDPNIQTFYAHEMQDDDLLMNDILSHLTDEVYVTIDADGLDPSIVPGVGTPEPGGLSYMKTLNLLKIICSKKKIVGFDIVECAPIKGQIQSQYVLAKLAYKILGYCTLNPKNFS